MKPLLCMLLALALAPVGRAAPAVADAAGTNTTVVIPVQDMIERGLAHVVLRGIREAETRGAGLIVLDMRTPGGKLSAAEDIVIALLQTPVPTCTFVNPRAISAGAIIALATDRIYMTPTGIIGDAMPLIATPFGTPQEIPEGLKEKVVSPTVALVRNAAQQKGHDARVAEAMVRPEVGLKIGDDVIAPAGQLLTLTSQDAARPVGPEQRPLLSSGTHADLAALLAALGRPAARVVTIVPTAAERVARAIDGFPLSAILLALGVLGLYVEFKAPGIGLPGIGGVLCLAIWFWGHQVAGLAGMAEIVIFALGFALLLVELLVIPGFGIVGISGIALMVSAMLMAMVDIFPASPPAVIRVAPVDWSEVQNAVVNLGLALVLALAAMLAIARYLPESALLRPLVLAQTLSAGKGFRASASAAGLVGARGVAETPLRPGGIGVFGGQRLSVVGPGEFVEAGTPIVIAEVHGARIVVTVASGIPDAGRKG